MYTKPTFRTKPNGVPILNKNEIDLIGERLVGDFCPQALQEPMEVDIDRFVSRFLGMKQDYQYLSHNGIYLGMTIFNDTDKVPIYDPKTQRAEYVSEEAGTVIIDNRLLEEKQEHRYRYTMGHEGSHCILHPDYFSNNSYQYSMFDTNDAPMITCRTNTNLGRSKSFIQWNDKDRMEWQANFLSSAILMPKKTVFKLVKKLNKGKNLCLPNLYVCETSSYFNVSYEAAEYRLKHLGVIDCQTIIDRVSLNHFFDMAM